MKQGVDTSAVIYCYMLKSLPYWPLRPSAWSRRTSTCIWHLLVCVCADTFYISDYLCVSLIKELPNFGFITKFITVHLCSFQASTSRRCPAALAALAALTRRRRTLTSQRIKAQAPNCGWGGPPAWTPKKLRMLGSLGEKKKDRIFNNDRNIKPWPKKKVVTFDF